MPHCSSEFKFWESLRVWTVHSLKLKTASWWCFQQLWLSYSVFWVKVRDFFFCPSYSDCNWYILCCSLVFISESFANNFLTKPEKAKSVTLGSTVTISATGSTNIDNALSWYLQKPGQHYTLSISDIQAEDVGDYYCVGYHYDGTFTQWIIAVQKPPSFWLKDASAECWTAMRMTGPLNTTQASPHLKMYNTYSTLTQ